MQKTESGLYYGHVPDGSVYSVVFLLCEQTPGFGSAAWRSLDSSREPSDVVAILRRHGIEARLGAGAAILTGQEVCRAFQLADREGLFTGFDELWCWREASVEPQFPPDIGLTSMLNLEEEFSSGIEEAMRALGSFLAMGDGCGLNFVTTDRDLAVQIEGQG